MARKPEPAEIDPVARFEEAMTELEDIVRRLEAGELRLDESLKLFERGTELTRRCRQTLDTAELKVKNLLDKPEAEDSAG